MSISYYRANACSQSSRAGSYYSKANDAMVKSSNDNCLAGLAAFVNAMVAPAVMTADMTANAAVQDDASTLDLPTKYEGLPILSHIILPICFSSRVSTHLIDPPNWPTATESAHSPDWSVNNTDLVAVCDHSDQNWALYPSAWVTDDESHAVVAGDSSTF